MLEVLADAVMGAGADGPTRVATISAMKRQRGNAKTCELMVGDVVAFVMRGLVERWSSSTAPPVGHALCNLLLLLS